MGYNISVEAPETSAERKDKSNMRVCVCAYTGTPALQKDSSYNLSNNEVQPDAHAAA